MNNKNKFFSISIALMLSLIMTNKCNAQSSIADARLANVGDTVTTIGVVTNGAELGIIRYMQDSTAGIAFYEASFSSIVRGDSILIIGTMTDYNGLAEIAAPILGYSVLGSGMPMAEPQLISIPDIGEPYEAALVRLNNVMFTDSNTALVGNTVYTVTDGTNNTVIYVRTNSPMIGYVLPGDTVDLIAICSQYTSYQLLLRDTNDIIFHIPDSVLTSRKSIDNHFNGIDDTTLKLYPNPSVDNKITLEFYNIENNANKASIIITDVLGKSNTFKSIPIRFGKNNFTLFTDEWNQGIYNISVQTSKYNYTSKYIKN